MCERRGKRGTKENGEVPTAEKMSREKFDRREWEIGRT